MNRTKIEWTDYTWNPITGCSHHCPYCYAEAICKRFGWSFLPTFHIDRLEEPCHIKKPSRIFVCSMGELFDSEISDLEINAVLGQIQLLPQHTFQILTKQIHRAQSFQFPLNVWLGITLDCLYANEEDLDILRRTNARIKFVSFEPLLGDFCGSLKGIDWVIIGSLTGIKAKQPPPCSVAEILIQCNRLEIPVFLKNNLEWSEKRQEFPKETTR